MFFSLILLILFVTGCATTPLIDKPLPKLDFKKEEVYVLDTSSLTETEAPNFIFLVQDKDGSFRYAEEDETPTFAALTQDELVKIDSMLTLKNAYKSISKEQTYLINLERDKINALKEMLYLERESRQLERDLRLESENAYRQERRDHKIDNVINKGTLVLTVIGAVAIAAL